MTYNIVGSTLALFVLMGWTFWHFVKEKIFRNIKWEFYAFRSEKEENVVLPANCLLPFYKKRIEVIAARDENPEWVPSDEMVPTGKVMIGNKQVRWAEVRKDYMIGYVPEAFIIMARIIPWEILKNNFQ